MGKSKVPELLLDYIKSNDKIMLFTHVRPDGDALGSLLGLCAILSDLGKEVICCLEEEVPRTYAFLPRVGPLIIGLENLKAEVTAPEEYLGIALDAGDVQRLGTFADFYLGLGKTFAIDHHGSHVPFGDGNWVVNVSSTGELVYELAESLGCDISFVAATNIYVAIVTDTGGFRYESTSSRTHEIAGKLIDCGVYPEIIGIQLYDNNSAARIQLMQLVLATLDVTDCGKIASVYVDQQMLDRTGALMDDTEGFVDYPRSIATVKVAMFLKDTGEDVIGVSLRAKGQCDVAEVAQLFGGGGHRNAAGFRLPGLSVKEARARVVKALELALS